MTVRADLPCAQADITAGAVLCPMRSQQRIVFLNALKQRPNDLMPIFLLKNFDGVAENYIAKWLQHCVNPFSLHREDSLNMRAPILICNEKIKSRRQHKFV